jgi:hypothetical protein
MKEEHDKHWDGRVPEQGLHEKSHKMHFPG